MKYAIAAGIATCAVLIGVLVWILLHPPTPATRAPVVQSACAGQPECGEKALPLPAHDAIADPIDYGARLLSSGATVQRVFERTCAACHLSGLAGAPRRGNREEWRTRIEKGMQALYHSALVGMPPGMPAKGLCFDCTEEDLQKMVDFLVEVSP